MQRVLHTIEKLSRNKKIKKIQDLQTCTKTYNDSTFDAQVFLLKYPNLNKSFLYQNPTKQANNKN